MNEIILIGGAPGVGKSTLAKRIAHARQVNWISTDQIRTIMQKATNRASNPDLFADANAAKTVEGSVAIELKQSEIVWGGVAEFIKHNHPWEGCVIEGTALLPRLIARDLEDRHDVHSIFLIQNEETIKGVIEQRSSNPWINTKTPEQQRKKAERTILFNNTVKQEATQYGFSVHELNGFADAYEELSVLGASL